MVTSNESTYWGKLKRMQRATAVPAFDAHPEKDRKAMQLSGLRGAYVQTRYTVYPVVL